MQLLVFGADGRVGRRLCEYAVSDGHSVTAFVRDAASAPPAVAVAEGAVTDADSVVSAVTETEAVCSALGIDRNAAVESLVGGVDNIVTAMEASGVDRLVAVAAAGILQATPSRRRLDTTEFPSKLERVAGGHWDVYERLRDSTLD